MRTIGLIRNEGSGYDRLAVIMALIAYIFVGGISGFGQNVSGHTPLETVHLPNAGRDSGVTAPERASYRLLNDGVSAEPQTVYQPVGTAPPPLIKVTPAAANDFAQFVSILILHLFTDARHAGLQFETQTVLTASPAWWLRTVVLHL